jgi:dienelactone hydrolase
MLFAPHVLAQNAPSDSALVGRAEALTDALLAGDTEPLSAGFNAQMQAGLPPEKLSELVSMLTAQLGAPQERLGTRIEAQPPITTVIVTQQFERAAADVQLSFDADGKVAGLFVRPAQPARDAATSALPPYADSTRYRAEEVTVDASVGLQLGGTLLVPEREEPVPGVVLVHGSGPSDRDGTVGPNKPLRDLAVGFASEGIATLRFDKRTAEYPAWFADRTYTVADESIDDVLAALDVLRQHPDVDPERLFVVGHSLGGTLAPRIAHRAAEEGIPVAGIVVLAGGARPLDLVLEDQLDYLDEVAPEGREQRAVLRDAVAQVRALTPADTAATEPIAGAPPAYWLDLAGHPPAPLAAALDVPVLVVHAGRDYQVTDVDFAVWQAALADDPAVMLRRYSSLNHLLIAGEGPSTPAEYERQGFVDATLIEETAAWIRGH